MQRKHGRMEARCRILTGQLFSVSKMCIKYLHVGAEDCRIRNKVIIPLLATCLIMLRPETRGGSRDDLLFHFARLCSSSLTVYVELGSLGGCWSLLERFPDDDSSETCLALYNHSYLSIVGNFILNYLTFTDWGCSTFLLPAHLYTTGFTML